MERITAGEVVRVIKKRKKLIAAVIIAFFMVGLLQSFIVRDEVYESQLLLEINNLKSEPAEADKDNSDIHNMLDRMSDSSGMDFESYVKELASDQVLEKTIKDLQLEDVYSVDSLKKAISVEENLELKNINLSLTSKDPKQADEILAKFTSNYISHITDISQEAALQTLDIIKSQMEVEKDKYQAALKEYAAITKDNKSAYELELEREASYEQLTEYKLSLNDLNIKKEGILAAIKQENNMGSSNNSMIIRPGSEGGYIYVDTSKRALQADLAETEARIKSTEASIEDLQKTVRALQIDYQDVEFLEGSVSKKVELTKESYDAFAQKYQELNMANTMNVGEISINVIADPNASPGVEARSSLNKITISIILGIMAGLILSLFLEYLQVMKVKRAK